MTQQITVGYYKCRNGSKARVLCVDAPGDYPVVGYVEFPCDSPHYTAWTLDGTYRADTDCTGYDLIEPWREPVRVSGWIRLYPDGITTGLWWSREEAELSATPGVVAIYVTGTEGVGPEGGE